VPQQLLPLGPRQFASCPIIIEPSPFTLLTFVKSHQLIHEGRASNSRMIDTLATARLHPRRGNQRFQPR